MKASGKEGGVKGVSGDGLPVDTHAECSQVSGDIHKSSFAHECAHVSSDGRRPVHYMVSDRLDELNCDERPMTRRNRAAAYRSRFKSSLGTF